MVEKLWKTDLAKKKREKSRVRVSWDQGMGKRVRTSLER